MVNNWMAYVAKEKCGCVTGVVVDDPKNKKIVAQDVARFVKSGRVLERVDGDTVKDVLAVCPFDKDKHYNVKICKECERNR